MLGYRSFNQIAFDFWNVQAAFAEGPVGMRMHI